MSTHTHTHTHVYCTLRHVVFIAACRLFHYPPSGFCQSDFPQCFAVTADNATRYFANMPFIQQSGQAYVSVCVCPSVCVCVDSPFPPGSVKEVALTSCQEVKPFNLIWTRGCDWRTVEEGGSLSQLSCCWVVFFFPWGEVVQFRRVEFCSLTPGTYWM